MKLTGDLIYGFAGSLLAGGFDEPAPTPDCHREWWDLCCSKYKRVAIAAPRGHAKSTAITKAYTLAAVLFRDRKYVLIVSDTYRQAVLFLGELKSALSTNDDLRALFGVESFEMDREDDIIVKMSDGYKFRITALGSEQKVRGLKWLDQRPDLIVGDDMENDELVMNPERREKFRVWFLSALLPTMNERGIVRIVGTILHMDSLLEGFMPPDRHPLTEHSPVKNWLTKPRNGWMGVRYRAHDGAEPASATVFLWPSKWSKARLQDVYDMFAGQGNSDGYAREMLNRPIDAKSAFFRMSDFQDWGENDTTLPFDKYPTYLSVDCALTTKERRDWSVFGIGTTDEQGMLYLRHVIRDRLDSRDIVDTIIRLHDRYRFSVLLIGKGQIEKAIGPFLRESLAKRGKYIHIEAIPEVVDKRSRAQSIRARMRSGGCKFDKRRAWYPDFEQELLEFDRGTHDDQVDMMSLFGMYLDRLLDAPTQKEIDDEEWEAENQKYVDFAMTGRSLITGY